MCIRDRAPVIQGGRILIEGTPYPSPVGWLVIEGLELRNGSEGVKLMNTHDIILRKNYIHDNANQGILGASARVTIDQNVIARTGLQSSQFHEHGIYMQGTDIAITNNLIDSNHAYGIQIAAYSYNSGTHAVPEYAGATNWLISNNTIALQDVRGGIIVWNAGTAPSGITVQNNIFYRNSESTNGDNAVGYLGSYNNIVVRNNLSYTTSGSASLPSGNGNIVGQDPRFVDLSVSNFRLQSNSPAINTGIAQLTPSVDIAGVLRPQGSAPEIGAYEFGGTADTTPPTAPGNLRVSN
jgi:hypothetical protein